MDNLYIMGLFVGKCEDMEQNYYGELACANYVANDAGKAFGLSDCHEMRVNFSDGLFKAYDDGGNLTEGEFDMTLLASLIEGDE